MGGSTQNKSYHEVLKTALVYIENPYLSSLDEVNLLEDQFLLLSNDNIPNNILPFHVSFDYLNSSPRFNAESLPESYKTPEIDLPTDFNKYKTENLNPSQKMQLFWEELTEPLFKDNFYIYITNLEFAARNETVIQRVRDVKKEYKKYMQENKIFWIKEKRDKYIDECINKIRTLINNESKENLPGLKTLKTLSYEKTITSLEKLKAIKRDEKHLNSRNDCIESFGEHSEIIQSLSEDLDADTIKELTSLCNHYNDACYENPLEFTALEIELTCLEFILSIIGGLLIILGALSLAPSFGTSSFLMAAGLAFMLSPGIFKGVGHIAYSGMNHRAPDTAKLIALFTTAISLVIPFATGVFSSLLAAGSILTPVAAMAITGASIVLSKIPLTISRLVAQAKTDVGFVTAITTQFDPFFFFRGLWDRMQKNIANNEKKNQNDTKESETSTKDKHPSFTVTQDNTSVNSIKADFSPAKKQPKSAPEPAEFQPWYNFAVGP